MIEKKFPGNEINLVKSSANKDLLIAFDPDLPWVEIPDNWTIHDILVDLKVFSSKSQSKKNWNNGELADGIFNWYERIGKKRWDIVVKC